VNLGHSVILVLKFFFILVQVIIFLFIRITYFSEKNIYFSFYFVFIIEN